MKRKPIPERVKRILELRRSSAAQPVKNKTKYDRHEKHPGDIVAKEQE